MAEAEGENRKRMQTAGENIAMSLPESANWIAHNVTIDADGGLWKQYGYIADNKL